LLAAQAAEVMLRVVVVQADIEHLLEHPVVAQAQSLNLNLLLGLLIP